MGNYSWGAYSTLPTDDADLSNILDVAALSQIASDDTVRLAQPADGMISIIQFKDTITAGSATVRWNGQSNVAPSSAAVNLEIYNRTSTVSTPAWEPLTSDNVTSADTDFTLSAYISDLTVYKNVNDIACRVYQAASGGPAPGTYYIGEGTHDGGTPCDFSGTTDNMLSEEYSTSNYSTALVIYASKQATYYTNGVIRFPGLSNLAGATITDVRLYLDIVNAVDPSETITLRRLLKDWVGNQSTWAVWQTGSSWDAGGATANTDRSDTVSATLSTGTSIGWVYFSGANLITDVQNFVNGTWNNYGWHMQRTDAGIGDGQLLGFASSEETSAIRPYLKVTCS